ncbi:MAG: NapC/NirT family cytochrome c [Deltaproteobacteria bacterium]|nr:NapC/NirT family cytochrome c [Candidatus Anaeroferrophillus wilburensis]MBN2889211.1 NapC/NirT family cytochrome c [Deltaproteobacteria bacterium]
MTHLKRMWELLTAFLKDFIGEAIRGTRQHKKGIIIFLVVSFIGLIALMATLLHLTANYQFCAMCHNMGTYIESWKQSSHREVSCLECHFEPGLMGELKGKWKAQTHVVLKITGTAPPRPHTQVSDASCLREGCHSKTDLSKSEVVFKGVNFSHDTHLSELRRGKKLKCTSCHSQIVQGAHLTVTETTCFTCHFYKKDQHPEMADCTLCHQQTKAKIFIDANENLPFIHKDYVDRGVTCQQCHFDVVFGEGHTKDNICVQCHAEPEILESQHTSEHIHLNHVNLHKVECFRCHADINHFIPRPSDSPVPSKKQVEKTVLSGYHYDSNCIKCHTFGEHSVKRQMFMGKGAEGITDMPSAMYLAHLDCASCHVALTETTSGQVKGVKRQGYDELITSCSDCHGPGYDDMAKHWKKLLNKELESTEETLLKARNKIAAYKKADRYGDASLLLEQAHNNLQFTKNGHGLHNIDYALKILASCRENVEKALALVIPKYVAKEVLSPTGCTDLCHSCVECIETKPVPFGNVQFPHDTHVIDEGLSCEECHSAREQHGKTFLQNCSSCHHGSGMGSVQCEDCHVAAFNLYKGQNACDEISCDVRGAANSMAEGVTCQECHVQIAAGEESSLEGIKATCIECHDHSYGPMVDDWQAQVEAMDIEKLAQDLQNLQRMVLNAIRNGQYTYDAQDLLNNAEKNLKQLAEGNPIHNLEFSKDLAGKVRSLLEKAKGKLLHYSTIKTLSEGEYK